MQKTHIDTGYTPPSDEEIRSGMDFESLIQKSKGSKFIILWPVLKIAATVFLLVGSVFAMTYWAINFSSPQDYMNIQTEKQPAIIPDEIPETRHTLDVPNVWYVIDNNQDQWITTPVGNTVYFERGSFPDSKDNKVVVYIGEVTDTTSLVQSFHAAKIALHIAAFDSVSKREISFVKAATYEIRQRGNASLSGDISYSEDFRKENNWQPISKNPQRLIKINRLMTEYKDYMEALNFMSGLDKTSGTSLSGTQFHYTLEYMAKVKAYIQHYEADPYFKNNVWLARLLWGKYESQSKIVVSICDDSILEVSINRNGWWRIQ